MKQSIVIITIVLGLMFPSARFAQGGEPGKGDPKMTDGRGKAGDPATLTDDQKSSVKSILSKYNASTLTADDAKAIHKAFRDAGLRAGPGLNDAVNSAGFNPYKLRDLDPPPDKKSPREDGGENRDSDRRDRGQNLKSDRQ